jgi:hypothetical protein
VSYLALAKQARARLNEENPSYEINEFNEKTPINLVNLVYLVTQNYAFPWPDSLPGLGSRIVGPFDRCACGAGSWVRYGAVVVCLPCAKGIHE